MIYEHATLVVTAAVAANLRKLAQMLDRSETDGMFTTGLSATGNLPATHFISSGQMPSEFVRAMESPVLMRTRASKAYAREGAAMPFNPAQTAAALARCMLGNGKRTALISAVPTEVDEGPHEMLSRLGLKLIQGTL